MASPADTTEMAGEIVATDLPEEIEPPAVPQTGGDGSEDRAR